MELPITLELLSYITAGLVVLLVVFIIMLVRLHARTNKLLRGRNAETLEDTIREVITELGETLDRQEQQEKTLAKIEKDLAGAISGVGVIRFNPFEGSSGSNQSFALALLNQHGDGVIVSSLYSRERVSVFAKPVKKFDSEYNLTEEEMKALGKARGV